MLESAGLPGPDFTLNATNNAMDSWLPRAAEYGDFRRALHLLLVTYARLPADTAVEFTPHGFRHVLIIAGQQLRQEGLVQAEGLESLGHWEPGSRMPRAYDTESGVTELGTRHVISEAIRTGWRPVDEGSLPVAVVVSDRGQLPLHQRGKRLRDARDEGRSSGADGSPYRGVLVPVGHRRRQRVHFVEPPAVTTVCGWWSCGSGLDPSPDSIWTGVGSLGFPQCRGCLRVSRTALGRGCGSALG